MADLLAAVITISHGTTTPSGRGATRALLDSYDQTQHVVERAVVTGGIGQ